MYLPVCKVADTPFHIQGEDISTGVDPQRIYTALSCPAQAAVYFHNYTKVELNGGKSHIDKTSIWRRKGVSATL